MAIETIEAKFIYHIKEKKNTMATLGTTPDEEKQLTRYEYVWRELCAKLPKKKFRMLSRDAYASLLLHDKLASPREAFLVLLEKKDGRVLANAEKVLFHLSKRGKVFESLCWLHGRAPDLLRTRWSSYSEVLEGELSGPEHHQRLVKSVSRWLAAWSNFIK